MRKLIALFMLLPPMAGAESLPDPTRPFGYGVEPIVVIQEEALPREQMNWQLSGIRIAENDRSAILNGRHVREGDRVDGAKIVSILPASVVIDFDSKRIRVDLLTLDIKQNRKRKNNTSNAAHSAENS